MPQAQRLQLVAHLRARDRLIAQAQIVGNALLQRLGIIDDDHRVAQLMHVELVDVRRADAKAAAVGDVTTLDQRQNSSAQIIVVVLHPDLGAGRQCVIELVADAGPLRVDTVEVQAQRASRQGLALNLRFLRRFEQLAEFVDGSAQLVVLVQQRRQARQRREHRSKDQFRGDQLAERQLVADHQPAADAQQSGAGQRVQSVVAAQLRQLEAEVTAMLSNVGSDQILGLLRGVADRAL